MKVNSPGQTNEKEGTDDVMKIKDDSIAGSLAARDRR